MGEPTTKSNYQEFGKTYAEELAGLGLPGKAPCVAIRQHGGLNCLVPLRIRATTDNREQAKACEHELTFTVHAGSADITALETRLSEMMAPRAEIVAIGPAQAAAWLIELSENQRTVTYHIGKRLEEYDGKEMPQQLAETLMDTLNHAATNEGLT